MCELTTITTALMVASTVVGGVGQYQQAQAAAASHQAQAAAAQYNSQIAEMNAKLADQRARDAIMRGQEEEQRKRAEVAQLQGRQRAAFGANNVDLGFGSPLDTLIDTAVMGELDALTIRRNAAREAYDFDMQAVNARAQAGLDRMTSESQLANASAARTGGVLAAAGTVLGGMSRVGAYRHSLANPGAGSMLIP